MLLEDNSLSFKANNLKKYLCFPLGGLGPEYLVNPQLFLISSPIFSPSSILVIFTGIFFTIQ